MKRREKFWEVKGYPNIHDVTLFAAIGLDVTADLTPPTDLYIEVLFTFLKCPSRRHDVSLQVRVLEDFGEIYTANGNAPLSHTYTHTHTHSSYTDTHAYADRSIRFSEGVVNLEKNTTHFLPRSDVEGLIRRGILEHLV